MTQTVDLADTTSDVSSSLNSSVYGQSVRFTATVTANSPSAATVDSGTVQFLIDGVDFGAPVSVNSSGVVDAATCAPDLAASTMIRARQAISPTQSQRPRSGSCAHSAPFRSCSRVIAPKPSPIASDPIAPTVSQTMSAG